MNKKIINFEDIDFHDAVILSIKIDNLDDKRSKITIECEVYILESDSKREKITIIFNKIKRGNIVFNSSELYKNVGAGNIDFAYIYKNTYQFNLFGGYIEIKTNITPKVILEK